MIGTLAEALCPLPTEAGGAALVLVAGGTRPSSVLLSSGNVHLEGERLRVAIRTGSSVLDGLDGELLLLVPSAGSALRALVEPTWIRAAGTHAVLEGRVLSVRTSVELPWALALAFVPSGADGADAYLAFWRSLRSWLAAGAVGDAPAPPAV